MLEISRVADDAGVLPEELEPYGRGKAKVRLDILERLKNAPDGRYVLVTAMNPTPLGEGKTVTTIGLSQSLGAAGKKVFTTLRQPSMGPVFGVKGGGTGGGGARVEPAEDINIHFTGDNHAVSAAHNMLAAFLDTSVLRGNPTGIDHHSITWRRVVDLNDRALREIVVGLGGKQNGIPRETGFDISAASEIMAILALACDLADLRGMLDRVVVGFTSDGKPVTAKDLECAGALAVLLKDAVKPNLAQTSAGTPAFIHAGPFANIAHGSSSIIADRMALKLSDYTVTEAGFGADCGMEKFVNIKCRASGLRPNAVVMVATVRALKAHSGKYAIKPGKPLDAKLFEKNVADVEAGGANLAKHIENADALGLPVVVAVNRMKGDHQEEIDAALELAKNAGACDAVVSEVFSKGPEGGKELADAVMGACERKMDFKFLYPLEWSIRKKIEAVALKFYGAARVHYSVKADRQIGLYEKNEFGKFPVCMAKTQYSLSHDPDLKGRPEDFTFPVNEVRVSAGAGFTYPVCGTMSTMPGLPTDAAGKRMDLDEKGGVVGLT